MDLEQELRSTYAERLGGLDLPGGDVASARRTGARMRARRRLSVGAAAVAVVAVALGGTLLGTGRVSIGPSQDGGHWRELPSAPLSPRANAQAVWTGQEVIVLGGETQPCPPNADCVSASPLLRDGAAYDPATDSWHPIAKAPVPVGPGDRLGRGRRRRGAQVAGPSRSGSSTTRRPTAGRDHRRPFTPVTCRRHSGSDVYVLAGRRVAVYALTTARGRCCRVDPIRHASGSDA